MKRDKKRAKKSPMQITTHAWSDGRIVTRSALNREARRLAERTKKKEIKI